MNWKDIPQYTSTNSCYHVEMGITAYIDWIENEIKDSGLQMNPELQRGHVWTKEQEQKYIEHILRGGKTSTSFYFNFPSINNYCANSQYNDFICVDGLQRTTAIQKFLRNELDVLGHYYRDFPPLRRTEMNISVYINDLKTKAEVYTWYVEMNDGGTPHTREEITRVKELIAKEFEKSSIDMDAEDISR